LGFLRELLGCEFLDLDVREEWSARHSDSREKIRAALSARWSEDLSDLSAPPRSLKSAISISHCRLVGGFALAPSEWALGFDVEEAARVRESVMERVTTSQERAEAPSLGALWAAKEAGFKALSSQISLISEISVGGWRPRLVPSLGTPVATPVVSRRSNLSDVFSFELSNPQTTPERSQGVVFTREELVFALFLKAPADISQLRSGATEKSYIQGGVRNG
ncbi:MAG: 4'-phosphopantetheinyl transferase superfamily protein, partial [Proteobacteria bacterium]